MMALAALCVVAFVIVAVVRGILAAAHICGRGVIVPERCDLPAPTHVHGEERGTPRSASESSRSGWTQGDVCSRVDSRALRTGGIAPPEVRRIGTSCRLLMLRIWLNPARTTPFCNRV